MSKVLVVYFSHSGNTKVVAEKISSILGGDIFEIVTVEKYPIKYNLVVNQAKKEIEDQIKPVLLNRLAHFNDYDTIVIGYPMWWYTCPMAVFTFLESYDFSGKVILPFCTHEGSALSTSIEDIKKVIPNAIVKEGLAIRGSKVNESDQLISTWLNKAL